MELGLSLGGDTPVSVADDQISRSHQQKMMNKDDLTFCMALGSSSTTQINHQDDIIHHKHNNNNNNNFNVNVDDEEIKANCCSSSSDPPLQLQLDLLPFSPPAPPPSHPSFPWLSQILTASGEEGISSKTKEGKLGLDVKPLTALIYDPADQYINQSAAASPNDDSNSDTSSFQMDFSSIFRSSSSRLPLITKRDLDLLLTDSEREAQRSKREGGGYGGSTYVSDEDENGLGGGRKKLRLTKQQSAFLEDSFKEHNTLNPKQKLVLANQLNLRPRQVEVWFQNRRARTKLKQTEVDCEYLKTCCERLTEENRRLHKELQELRALKTNSHPFYMQPPPTTLTMCPSCERVVTTTNPTPATTTTEVLTKQPAN